MAKVPFFRPALTEDEIAAVADTLRSGWLTSGPNVKEFEREFADFVGAKHAIAVNSATAGALLVMQALGVGPGKTVAVPVWTFSGPAMMARHLGATVIPCDVDPDTLNLTIASVRQAMDGKKPDFIMPTHFAGLACPLEQFLSGFPGAKIIDDAAHAIPTVYDGGGLVGGHGVQKATFFSFYATKTITTGEGGMVTTTDDLLAERLRSLRLHGFNRPIEDRYTNLKTGWAYDIAAPGWKVNMTDIAATLGRHQLRKADQFRDARRRIARKYASLLQSIAQMPANDDGHAWHLFTIRVKNRDQFIDKMAAKGVQCSVHFIPLHKHSYWKGVFGEQLFPVADRVFEQIVSLPLYPSMTDEEIGIVVDAAKASV